MSQEVQGSLSTTLKVEPKLATTAFDLVRLIKVSVVYILVDVANNYVAPVKFVAKHFANNIFHARVY